LRRSSLIKLALPSKWWGISFIFILLLCYPRISFAEERNIQSYSRPFGLGLILGEPRAGLSGKYWTNSKNAIDFGLSWDFKRYLLVFADYLWHLRLRTQTEFFRQLAFYLGAGPVLAINGRRGDVLGLRIPLGVEWRPAFPIGIGVEIAPAIEIVPRFDLLFMWGVTARYYF